MDDNFKRLEDKLDRVNDRLSDIDKNVAVYNEQLKIHIEGTVQNRESIKLLREKFEADIKPIAKHVSMMEGAAKLFTLASVFVGLVYSVIKIFS